MTVTADSKKRVVVPDARPGDVFSYESQGNDHFALVRLTRVDPPKKKTRAQVIAAIKASKMRPMRWDELRKLTREP